MSRITFLYGTETGTAQEIAENFAFVACSSSTIQCSVMEADALPVESWKDHSPIVFFCSTTGQGDAPMTLQNSWNLLRTYDAPSMMGLRYAVFGLGDSTYSKFNVMAKMLHNRLQQLGGSPLVARGLGDDEDAGGYAEEMNKWAPKLWEALDITAAALKISDATIFRKYKVRFPQSEGWVCSEGGSEPRSGFGSKCTVVANHRITAAEHFQTVHHIEIDRPQGASLHALSVVGVWPKNNPSLVDRLAKACGLDCKDQVFVEYEVGNYSSRDRSDIRFMGRQLAVGPLLADHFDLEAAVSRTFLRALATVASDPEEKERLLELAADDRLVEFTDYAYREKRNCVEVIEDFSSCKVSLELILGFLKKLHPRYFSVSSSPKNDSGPVSLTVAKLEFVTPMHRQRSGLCSKQLCEAQPGDSFQCCVKEDTHALEISSTTPLLLIGPGTGIAPLRALIREYPTNKVLLYRGCRFHEKDNLYRCEWEDYEKARPATFRQHLAVSRENRPLRYVHHLMAQEPNAREIASLIREGAVIVVCGNSKQMPKDVERTLESIGEVLLPECGGNLLKVLKKENRLFFDTWS